MWKKEDWEGLQSKYKTLDQGNMPRILKKKSMHYVARVGIKTFYSRTYYEKMSEKYNSFVNKAD